MNTLISPFKRLFLEADEAPDSGPPSMDAPTEEAPADAPDMAPDTMDASPDLNEGPPDLGGMDDETDDMFDDSGGETGGEEKPDENLNIDEKISAIMNRSLYQKFLTLLNTIGVQISTIKNNSDVLFNISDDIVDVNESLKKLDENVRLYLSNQFEDENYSQNLLFFNKCVNLLKLLGEAFDKGISKGLRGSE